MVDKVRVPLRQSRDIVTPSLPQGRRSRRDRSAQLAIVQWHGGVGGAEVLGLELAMAFRRLGVKSELVFVTSGGPMVNRLAEVDIPFHVLGCSRGRDVLRHPHRYAGAVAASGPDGALLPECGFIGAALRGGGFDAPIVAIEHGPLLQRPRNAVGIAGRQCNRMAGAWGDDVEVGVSDFVVERMRRGPHARRFGRIHNGVDPGRFEAMPAAGSAREGCVVAGFAGRLIPGKGCDDAITAVASAGARARLRLLIAGDGPCRDQLMTQARRLGVADRVEFLGMVDDIRELWRQCDVAIFPSNQFIESFGMVALEAMACGRPVVAARNGAAPELVRDGTTGRIYSPGDTVALLDALVAYAQQPALARAHGAAGEARVSQEFHIDRCASAYLRCFGLLEGLIATAARRQEAP